MRPHPIDAQSAARFPRKHEKAHKALARVLPAMYCLSCQQGTEPDADEERP